MLALTTTGTPDLLGVTEVPDPEPLPTDVLVRVQATSLNRGEVSRSMGAPAGQRLGWDFVGVVERAPEAGGGPSVGSIVVGLLNGGAWAERVAAPADSLAVVPRGVTPAQAACLPVAGVTAFRALALGGFPVGRTVLVTGASGGVGHLAVQLARAAQMTVTGLIRTPNSSPVAAAACHHVVTAINDAQGPYDHVLDGVGGEVLTRCIDVVAPHGMVVSYASTLMEPATLGPRWFGAHAGATVRSMLIFEELRRTQSLVSDLTALGALVAAGTMSPHIDIEADWARGGELARALLERRVTGKVVLRIGRR